MNEVITFQVTYPGGCQLPTIVEEITITIDDDIVCNATSIDSNGYITCSLILSPPILPAGVIDVQIYWAGHGIFNVTPGLVFTPAPTCNTVSPSTVPHSGGVLVTLQGTGFGKISTTSISVGGCSATIISITTVEIVFEFPNLYQIVAVGTLSITITVNGVVITQNITTYASIAPTVTLNLTSTSPVLTTYILGTLQGNTETNISNFNAALESNDGTNNPDIPCYIFQLSLSSLTCAIPGGIAGIYSFVLTHSTYGRPYYNPTIELAILVTSISKNTGSDLGGNELVIVGDNFSPVLNENQVYIGPDLCNTICNITAANKTQLVCTVGAIQPCQQLNTSYQIQVYGRLQQVATDSPVFNYIFAHPSASVSSVNTTIVYAGNTLLLQGSGFSCPEGDTPLVFFGGSQATVLDFNDRSITCIVPELDASAFGISVLLPCIGYIHTEEIVVSSPLQIFTKQLYATTSGNRITILGNGFSYPSVYIKETSTPCDIVSTTQTQIVCDLVISFTYGGYYTIALDFVGLDSILIPLTISTITNYTVKSISTSYSTSKTTLIISGSGFVSHGSTNRALLSYKGIEVEGTIRQQTLTETSFTVDYTKIGAGYYDFSLYAVNVGFASIKTTITTVTVTFQQPTPRPSLLSFGGKREVTYSGYGFQVNPAHNDIRVCGLPVLVTQSSFYSVTFNIPPIITPASQLAYSIGESAIVKPVTTYGSNPNCDPSLISDGDVIISYISTTEACEVGLDFGEGTNVRIDTITYYPDPTLSSFSELEGAQIIGVDSSGVDHLMYTILACNVKNGANTLTFESIAYRPAYRYVKFTGAYCRITELVVTGIRYVNTANNVTTNNVCDLDFYFDNVLAARLPGEFTCNDDITPKIYQVIPYDGQYVGNTVITIYGSDFGDDQAKLSVWVNEVECENLVYNEATSQINCTTGYAADYNNSKDFYVEHADYGVAVNEGNTHVYRDRWTNPATWGELLPPTTGDIVYIPPGQALLFDALSPVNVVGILVEGELFFEDGRDYQLSLNWILVDGGSIYIGSEDQPFQNKINITLLGETADVQIPIYGNKALAIRGGEVLVYGAPKTSWSNLVTTASAGSSQITVQDITGWAVGDIIAIASTDFQYNHYEVAQITAINSLSNQLSLNITLQYNHYAKTETYSSGRKVGMFAEIGVLTRNILIQGDASSENFKYGAHVMISQYGTPVAVNFSNVEFTRVGQRGQKERFPINFVQIYDAPNSSIMNCSIHHSYNRGVRILQSNYITFQSNVLFDIQGHGFYLESSTEVKNVFDGNLVFNIQSNFYFETTDLTPAAFFFTNPDNFLSNNVAANSQYYGFAYSLNSVVTEAMTEFQINSHKYCPTGTPLPLFVSNIAHSNTQEGLWVWPEFIPRTCLCSPNDWTTNLPISAIFKEFLAYKHPNRAIYLYSVGDVRFYSLTLVDNSNEGIFVNYAANAPDYSAQINNSLIVGYSQGNSGTNYNSIGIIVPASEYFVVSNVDFENFDSNMYALATCGGGAEYCYDGQARTFRVWGLTFKNIVNRLLWRASGIFRTEDISLSGVVGWSFTLQTHNLNAPNCVIDAKLLNTITCNTIPTVRRIQFNSIQAVDYFPAQTLRILRLSIGEDYTTAPSTSYSDIGWDNTIGAFTAPFILDFSYHCHFSNGSDWNRTVIEFESLRYLSTDSNVIIEFNHTDPRELYDVYVGGITVPQLPNGTTIEATTLGLKTGNYTHANHDPIPKNILRVAVNYYLSRYSSIDMHAVVCRYTCPPPPANAVIESIPRYWSDPNAWTNRGNTVPQDGDYVVIESTWWMILDVNSANLVRLEVNGLLQAAEGKNVSLNVMNIWVHAGTISAGSNTSAYTGFFAINLLGNFNEDPYLVIDSRADSGEKILVVTGSLLLYGTPLVSIYTKLIAPAYAFTKQIVIENPQNLNIQIGDLLVIGPSGFDPDESDTVTVASVSGNIITLNEYLYYDHYGSSVPYTTKINGLTIDFCSYVGKLNRNIQISGGDYNWGGRIYIYESTETNFVSHVTTTFSGLAVLNYVALINLGQDGPHAGVHFDYLSGISGTSILNGCSFYNSTGWAVHVHLSNKVTIQNSVFIWPVQHAIHLEGGSQNQVIDNLVIGTVNTHIINNVTIDLIASISSFSGNPKISNNIVAGSEGVAFVFTADACGTASPTIGPNQANSVETGFVFNAASDCVQIKYLQVFHANQGGINSYAAAIELIAEGLIVTDNQNGSLNLNLGGKGDLAQAFTITLSNSYVGGVTYPLVDFFDTTYCNGILGIRIPVVTIDQNSIPFLTWQQPYWGIFSSAVFAAYFYINGVEFENFNNSNCTGHYALQSNPTASDASALTIIQGVAVNNVSQTQFVDFVLPNPSWQTTLLCGNFECSGLYNVLVEDITGAFKNQPGVYIPNVSGVVNADQSCSVLTPNNETAFCSNIKYGVISFDSQDTDSSTRLFSPVNITAYGGGTFSVSLNTFMNHNPYFYNQSFAEIQRLSRYSALIPTLAEYELTLTGTHPNTMRFELLGAADSDYVIIRTTYESPLLVTVSVGSNSVNPNILVEGQSVDLKTQASTCGSNNYYPATRILEFVLNGNSDCLAILQTQDSLYVTIRYQTTVAEFFSENGPATFVDKLAALCDVPPYDIRTVSVVTGSAIISVFIPVNQDSQAENYTVLITNAIDNGDLDLPNAPVLDFQFTILTQNSTASGTPPTTSYVRTYPSSLSKIGIIFIAIGAAVFLFCLVLAIIICRRIRSRKHRKVMNWTGVMPNSPISSIEIQKQKKSSDKKGEASDDKKEQEVSTIENFIRDFKKISINNILDSEGGTSPSANTLLHFDQRSAFHAVRKLPDSGIPSSNISIDSDRDQPTIQSRPQISSMLIKDSARSIDLALERAEAKEFDRDSIMKDLESLTQL